MYVKRPDTNTGCITKQEKAVGGRKRILILNSLQGINFLNNLEATFRFATNSYDFFLAKSLQYDLKITAHFIFL